jgi:photosystem II stability/assembly factor-like uncharacterized protein
MLAVLSCNGGTLTTGGSAATRLLAATLRGVQIFERPDTAAPWQKAGAALTELHVSALLFEPASGLVFAGGHGKGGLWVSTDLGETWARSDAGLESSHIYTIAAQPRPDGVRLFVGTEPVMLYYSDDLSQSWHALPNMLHVPNTEHWTFPPPPHWAHVKNVAFHPSLPDTLYVCIEQGALLKSEDAGQSWIELDEYADENVDFFRNDNHRVVIKPSDPAALFMCGGEGLYSSQDAGETWNHLTTRDFDVGYPDAMFLDPRDDNALFMAGPRNPPRAWREQEKPMADPAVLHSADNGKTWRKLDKGLPPKIVGNFEAMGLHYGGGTVSLYAGTATGEIYHSDDAGENWALLADGLPPISKGGHYRWFMSDEQRQQVEQHIVAVALGTDPISK